MREDFEKFIDNLSLDGVITNLERYSVSVIWCKLNCQRKRFYINFSYYDPKKIRIYHLNTKAEEVLEELSFDQFLNYLSAEIRNRFLFNLDLFI